MQVLLKAIFMLGFLSFSAMANDDVLESGEYYSQDNASCKATVAGGEKKLAVSLNCGNAKGTFIAAKVNDDLFRYCESKTYCYNFEIINTTAFMAFGTKNGTLIGNKLLYIKE